MDAKKELLERLVALNLGKEAEILYKITMFWKTQLVNTKNRIIKSKGYMTRKREINSI